MHKPTRKESQDAWVMLACTVSDETIHRVNGAMQNTNATKRVMQATSGEGFDPEDISHVTDHGMKFLRRNWITNLGASPAELRHEHIMRRRKG